LTTLSLSSRNLCCFKVQQASSSGGLSLLTLLVDVLVFALVMYVLYVAYVLMQFVETETVVS